MLQPESDWVRERAETKVDDEGREDDGVEREEAESQLSGNFPEGCLAGMGARPESGGRSPC